jgi:hypothetical protein
VMQIEDRPMWIEVAMLTRLERKLRAELGSPAPPPAKSRPKADDNDKPADKPKDEPPKADDGGLRVSPTP